LRVELEVPVAPGGERVGAHREPVALLRGSPGCRGSGAPRGPRVSQNTHVSFTSSASVASAQMVVAAEYPPPTSATLLPA
jgi:hypothetical protein